MNLELYENELESLQSKIRTLVAEQAQAKLQGRPLSLKEIEYAEAQERTVLEKLEKNLKEQLKAIDGQLNALRQEGAPESAWERAHWDREILKLEDERAGVLEQLRLNLEQQRDALDRTLKRRANAQAWNGKLHPDHEVDFKTLSDRRGELMRELAIVSGEGTQS